MRKIKEYLNDYFRILKKETVLYWSEIDDYKKMKFKWYKYISLFLKVTYCIVSLCYILFICFSAFVVLTNTSIMKDFEQVTAIEAFLFYLLMVIFLFVFYSIIFWLVDRKKISFHMLLSLYGSAFPVLLVGIGIMYEVVNYNLMVIASVIVIVLKPIVNHIYYRTKELEMIMAGRIRIAKPIWKKIEEK